MSARPIVFLASNAAAARAAVWQHLGKTAFSLLDPPLVLSHPTNFSAWRELSHSASQKATPAPRLIGAEEYFARSHASLVRQRSLRGTDRAWVLAETLRSRKPGVTQSRLLQRPDFPKRFGSLVGRLRRTGKREFSASEVAGELNELLQRYEQRLAALKAFDYEAAPALFTSSSLKNLAFEWPKVLVVDDLLNPSPVLQQGLYCLFDHAQTVVGTLVCPGGVEDSAALQSALGFWKSRGAEVVRVGEFSDSATRAAARFLGEEVEVERPGNILLTQAHTPWDEVNRIAARIRQEVEAGARLDDFAIAFADPESYRAIARHAFAAHGIPLDWPTQPPIANSPLVQALLKAAQAGPSLDVHILHELFADGTLELQFEERKLDTKRLRQAARAARTYDLDDLEATREKFSARVASLSHSSKRDAAGELASIEASLAAGDLDLVAHFTALRLPAKSRLGIVIWQLHLHSLIEQLAGHWLEGDSPLAEAARATLTELKAAIERVVERSRGWSHGEEEEPQQAVSEWMRWLQMEIELPGVSATRGGAVQVESIGAFRDGVRTLFLCGLNEGAWPASPSSNWLGEGGREIENNLQSLETSAMDRAAHNLARAMSAPQLSLSYARFVDGKEKSGSMLLDDLRAAWPSEQHGAWPSLEELDSLPGQSRRAHLLQQNKWLTSNGSKAPIEPHLSTLLKIRDERARVQPGIYDGVLGEHGGTLMAGWRQMQGDRNLSVSALERYATCPIRFFFERILALKPEENVGDDVDPRAVGDLVHAIAHQFLKTWSTPLIPEDFDSALEKLHEVAWEQCQKLPIRPILREAEYFRLMGADQTSGPLVKWLKLEVRAGGGAWPVEMRPLTHTPHQVLGLGDGLEQKFNLQLGSNLISGVIDRLDFSPDGAQMAVIDYKTGNIANLPSWKSGDDGLHFQLPIYALAARDMLSLRTPQTRLSMVYLMMRDAKIARGVGQHDTLGKGCSGALNLPDERFEGWLQEVEERVERIATLVNAGTFNLSLQSPADAKCSSCGMKSLCGQRVEVQKQRLEALRGSDDLYAPELRKWEEVQ